ncbi:MAG: hypothetical protein K2P92_07355 [Bdellovibrionaceae bacterium]|nr:hypothetical protein [Pseudobdellovibrionaceae bacterium]
MKQIIALNQWLYGLRKIILTSGYIALVAVAAGADVKVKNADYSLSEVLPFRKDKIPNTLLIQQCPVAQKTNESSSHQKAGSCKAVDKLDQKNFNSTLDSVLSEPIFKMQTQHNHKEV